MMLIIMLMWLILIENVIEFYFVINEFIIIDVIKFLKNNKVCENDIIFNVNDFFKYGFVKCLFLFVKIFDIV